jgi:hypothetical protein
MASLSESTHGSFDKELWKTCCQQEFVECVTKSSPEYPLVLKRYRDIMAMRNTPEYIKLKKESDEKQRAWLEWMNSDEYKQEQKEKAEKYKQLQKEKAEAYKKQKEDEKKWLQKARESMSWGT